MRIVKTVTARLGAVMAVGYLILFIAAASLPVIDSSDGLAFIWVALLTQPWCFFLLSMLGPNPSFGPSMLVFTFCGLLNATILYIVGRLLTRFFFSGKTLQ